MPTNSLYNVRFAKDALDCGGDNRAPERLTLTFKCRQQTAASIRPPVRPPLEQKIDLSRFVAFADYFSTSVFFFICLYRMYIYSPFAGGAFAYDPNRIPSTEERYVDEGSGTKGASLVGATKTNSQMM